MRSTVRSLSGAGAADWSSAPTVRVPSRATPPPVAASLTAWWDFSDLSTLSLVSGGIDAIGDKSGNGRTLAATSSSTRPTWTVGTDLSATLGVARFDGSSDEMSAASSAGITGSAWTVFAAADKRGAATGALWQIRALATYLSGGNWSIWTGSSGPVVTTTAALYDQPRIHMRLLDSTTHKYRINGVEYLSTSGGSGSAASFWLGSDNGTNYGDFDIGEVLVYDAALTEAQIDAVCRWLGSRWSVYQWL